MSSQSLKRALLANALFSLTSGVLLVFFASFWAALFEAANPIVYRVTGIGLLAFTAFVLYLAIHPSPNTFDALLVSIGDIGWVIGSGILLAVAHGALSTVGIWLIIAVAVIVLTFAIAQLRGIDRMFRVDDGETQAHRICMEIETDAPAEKLWSVIADMGSIKEFSPHLAKSQMRNGALPAPGAVRECSDLKGNRWAEECVVLDNEYRSLGVTFLATEPDFPYPFRTMDGGWQVRPWGNGSVVTIWFETMPKYRLATPFILAIMTRDLVPNFTSVVANMAARAKGQPFDPETGAAAGVHGVLIPC